MKKFFTKKALVNLGIFCLFATIILSAHTALAQIPDYTVLAPLPGTTECANDKLGADCKTTLERYLPGLFNLLIGIAAVFAVLMIVLGGIQYMSSDALQGKEDGKARIWNAVKGLVLVIGAWLILTTINPKLLEINLNIDPVTVSSIPAGTLSGTGGGSVAGTPENIIQATTASCPSCILTGTSYNLTQANIARFDCQTCAPMTTGVNGIPISSNNMNKNVEPDLNNRLLALNNGLKQQGISWGATEAFPPVTNHSSACHYNGTCIDATLGNASPSNIRDFVVTARNNQLRAQFETQTEAERDALRSSLVTLGMTQAEANASVIHVPGINGRHFSVYKQ